MHGDVSCADDEISERRPERFIVHPLIASEWHCLAQSELSVLFHDLDGFGTCVEGIDDLCARICSLGQSRAPILGLLERRPDFLHDLAASFLETPFEGVQERMTRGII